VKQRERLLSHRDQLEARLGELDQKLMDPEVSSKPSELRKLGKERSDVDTLVRKLREYQTAGKHIDEAQALLADETDEELRALAKADLDTYEPRVEALEKEISNILFPADPNDAKDVIMEVRAGTGGDEAALFAGELYRMYTRYAERQGNRNRRSQRRHREPVWPRRVRAHEVRKRRTSRAACPGDRSLRTHSHLGGHGGRAAGSGRCGRRDQG
jgi:protein subunit release factor A